MYYCYNLSYITYYLCNQPSTNIMLLYTFINSDEKKQEEEKGEG